MKTLTWRHGDEKQRTEAHAIFLNPFAVYSLCKRKSVICQFVDEEKNGSFPFSNGLNGLKIVLAHLCLRGYRVIGSLKLY
jgi:hypothetical protein